ncbi:MAG: hypothetical protein RBU37_07540 [Myxococcota bacterium]|jgi:hypothetical protein|nr:hypothetical protein [Myxococcota bacterium]
MDNATWLGQELRVAERRGTDEAAFSFCLALAKAGYWREVWGFTERYLARLDRLWEIDGAPPWPEAARWVANVARLLQPMSRHGVTCQRLGQGFSTTYAADLGETAGPNPLPLYMRAVLYWCPERWSEWMRTVVWSTSCSQFATLARFGILSDGATRVAFDEHCPELPELPSRVDFEHRLRRRQLQRYELSTVERSWWQSLMV